MIDPKLRALAAKIQEEKLRTKTIELMQNPTVKIGTRKFKGLSLDFSPAGLSRHHSYPGGYIEHVVSTISIALAMCDSVEQVYHGKVKRDIVLAGILLHDLFKPLTYGVNEDGNYVSMELADYLDHLTLAVAELVRRDFPLEVVHAVAAHHGAYGPVRPRSLEALICHLADLVDSRLNGEVLSTASYLIRRAIGEDLPKLTSKEAFAIVRSKSIEGSEGVVKSFEKIRRKRQPRVRKT
jgi:7,8-dihydroneopterin 2',3'-cyclic phosphate phosphodiesterase